MADMKLRECPFCGNDDIEIDKSIPDSIHLTCKCGADYLGFEIDDSLDEVIEDWNTRASDSTIEAQEAEIKRLRESLNNIAGNNDVDGNSMICGTLEECQREAKIALITRE